MLFSALFALLPLLASASPIQKRATNQLIVSGRDGKCLSPRVVPNLYNGLSLTTVDCDVAAGWDISFGSGSILLGGGHNDYAVDIGLNPQNNGPVYLWQPYPGSPQQTFYLTDDNRIAQTGGTQCLDEGDNGPQIYQCTTGNTNQVWYIKDRGSQSPSPSSTSSAAATPSATGNYKSWQDYPVGTTYSDSVSGRGGRRIHPDNRNDLCITADVFAGTTELADNTPVAVTVCYANDDPKVGTQLWDWPTSSDFSVTRTVKLAAYPDFCLDAGNNPHNGGPAKMYTCGDGNTNQQWTLLGARHGTVLKINDGTNAGQCLDIKRESVPARVTGREPTVADMQTWSCDFPSGDDIQQHFGPITN